MGAKEWFRDLFSRSRQQKRLNKSQTRATGETPQSRESMRVRVDSRSPGAVPLKEARSSNLSPAERLLSGATKSELLREYTGGVDMIASDLASLFVNAVQDRRQYMENADELRRYPIAKRVLKILAAQILKPDKRGRVLNLTSKNPEYAKLLNELQNAHNLDNLLKMICKDVLLMGEFTLAVEAKQGKGVTAIMDSIDQLGVVAFYDRGFPSGFLRFRKGEYMVEPPDRYCHFVIGEEKMRLSLNDALYRGYAIDFDNLPDELKDKIPEFIRVGEPIFYGLVEKIRQLQILEQIVIATKLANITQRKLVSLNVPPNMPVQQVQEACEKFQQLLNNQMGVDTDISTITVGEIVGESGRFSVIPNYTSGVGGMTPLDVRNDPQVDDVINSIDDYRETFLTSVGIPYRLVYGVKRGTENDVNRGDEIRVYAMFFDMISEIQTSIGLGFKQLGVIHLRNLGHPATHDDVECVYLNGSVNVGDLERMEYDDAKLAIIKNKLDLIQTIAENEITKPRVKPDKLIAWLDKALLEITDGISIFGLSTEEEGLTPDSPEVEKELVSKIAILKRVRDNLRANLSENDLDDEQKIDDKLEGH